MENKDKPSVDFRNVERGKEWLRRMIDESERKDREREKEERDGNEAG